MRILVTGATGFIGSRLASRGIDQGYEITAFGQTGSDWEGRHAHELRERGARVIVGSILDKGLLKSACHGVGAIIHLAAAQHESNVGFDYFRKVNVEGTRNLIEASIDAGVARFVYGSTIGVYGAARGEPLTELSPVNPQNHYAVSKLMAEQTAQEFSDRIQLVIARISETYGPEDQRLLKLFKGIAKGWFPVVGSCRNKHQPVFVDELAGCLLEIAGRSDMSGELVNLAGPEPVSTIDMIHRVEEAMHCHNHNLRIPLTPLLGAAVVLEKVLPTLGVSPPLTRRRLDFYRTEFWFDTTRARRCLASAPKMAFREGAVLAAEWYKSHGLLPAEPAD